MADVYVRSLATGAGTGADWANAYTRLDTAMTAKAAGDTFWIAHDHAETQASNVTITSPGTEATPCRVYCVNASGSVPPVAADLRTTGQISTTGTSAITMAGTVSECYGLIINCSTGGSTANLNLSNTAGRSWRYTNCLFKILNTQNASRIAPGGTIWENCQVQFGATGQQILLSSTGRFIWRNTLNAIQGATIPTTLFNITQTFGFCEGIDFSAMGAGKALAIHATNCGNLTIKNCKLNASMGLISGTGSFTGTDFLLINCDSGDTNYRTERYSFMGQQTVEATIVLTGGASDGTTPISWRIATTADSEKDCPYEALPIVIWNDTVGSSKTLTIQGIWGGGSVPNNDDVWIDVEYMGTSGFPIVSKVSSGRATPLTGGSAYSAGSGTWGGSTTKFAMSVTFTPQEKGPVTVYVKAALASSTFYIDPKPVIT